MFDFFEKFRNQVLSSMGEEPDRSIESGETDRLIALGVLMWAVSEADEQFLPEERQLIEQVLQKHGRLDTDRISIVMESVRQAAGERIDLYSFADKATQNIEREQKVAMLEHLFRVACIDEHLDTREHETIRQIYQLFRLDHQDFIEAKIKVKKEFGMDTAGL